MPDITDLVPLDEFINTHFIPALTGQESGHDTERQLIALPTHLGGLGLTVQSKTTLFEHTHPLKVAAPLTVLSSCNKAQPNPLKPSPIKGE